jgi:hypothetical protein
VVVPVGPRADAKTDRWDPVSKQPLFKSGAVRIEKITQPEQRDAAEAAHIRVPEQQSVALSKVATQDAVKAATATEDLTIRQRKLDAWLGETYEGTLELLGIYETLIPSIVHDPEIESGLRVMHRLAVDMRAKLEPQLAKYENKDKKKEERGGNEVDEHGHHSMRRAHALRDALFPCSDNNDGDDGNNETTPGPRRTQYQVLETLQALVVFLAHIQSMVAALVPAAQALWDEGFVEAVESAQTCLSRMRAWAAHLVEVRSPQTLLVPV